jgi:hypothetical protein
VARTYLLQQQIASLMFGGASLDRVESEIIEPCGLDADYRAGLWLYAWSFLDGGDQRAQASGYLASLEGGGPGRGASARLSVA